MLASPALRTPRTCPSSTRRVPSLIHTIATSTPARECVRECRHIHIHTHTLYVPVLFSFPFLFLSLGHASTPFPHPRSSFEFCGKRVSLSSFLPPFLPVSPMVFFLPLSLSLGAIHRPLSVPSHSRSLPLLLLSLTDIPLPRANAVSLARSLSTTLSGGTPDRFGDSQINVSRTTCTDTSPLRLANSAPCTVQNFVTEVYKECLEIGQLIARFNFVFYFPFRIVIILQRIKYVKCNMMQRKIYI